MKNSYNIPTELMQAIVSLLNSLPAHQTRLMLNQLEAIVSALENAAAP